MVSALKAKVFAALNDPFALLAERSPGSRSPGPLHLTKSSAGPHERVLAQVREREPVASVPGVDKPVFLDNPATIASTPGVLPGGFSNAQDTGSPNPTFINTPLGFPGIPTTAGDSPSGIGMSPSNPGGTDTPFGIPGGTDPPDTNSGGTDTSFDNPGGTDPPPIGPGSIDSPPGSPGTSGSTTPPIIAVPEPATWALMILGLLGVFVIVRWRKTKRTA
jgi:PEP-CTERM motif